MKKISFLVCIISLLVSCTGKKNIPDVSHINVDLKLQRFDRDFFKIDTNNINSGLNALYQKYPVLAPIFLQNILGLDSNNAVQGIKRFIRLSENLFDTVNTVFKTTDELEKDLKKSFQYIKYYFPDYKVPTVATVAGPVDALAEGDAGPSPNFLAPALLGISLQFYLGPNFSVYNDPLFIEQVVPAYRSRRFSKEYIISDVTQLLISDIFPYKSGSRPLVEQMVEKGKRWYMLDKLIPHKHDSIKTGYTAMQLEWCERNEGLIWTYIVKNEDLYSLNPPVIQTYLGEGPFTQGFHQEYSPGNLGQWIGWQIVNKFAEKNSEMSPAQIMLVEPKRILDEARYKPK